MGFSVLTNVVFVALLCSTLVVGDKLPGEQRLGEHGHQRLRHTSVRSLAGSVTKLRLINADTDMPIAGYDPLPPRARIDLRTLPTPNLSVEAITNKSDGEVASVQWKFDGMTRVENFPRWAMCYNNGPDIYACQRLVAGFNSTITATPFTDDDAKGNKGASVSVQLSLFRSNAVAPTTTTAPQAPVAPAPSKATTGVPSNPTTKAPAVPMEAPVAAPIQTTVPMPVAVPSKSPIAEPMLAVINLTLVDFAWNGVNVSLAGNDTTVEFKLSSPLALSSPLTVRADVASNLAVQSVQFTYDGQVVRIENEAPYALAGKQGSVLSPWLPTPGRHTLSVTAFGGKNATGSILASSTVAFTAKLHKDTVAPLLLTLIAPERVNTISPPTTLELSLMARDDASGIARATVYLYTYVGFQNYTDHATATVRFDDATIASTKGKRFFFNVSLPYPDALPSGSYSYRVEVEDGAGNIGNENNNPFGEILNIQSRLWAYERRVDLLNVTTTPTPNPTITVNASGLVTDVPVQITLKDDQGSLVCVSASGNGFSTEDGYESVQSPGSFQFRPNCKDFPANRVPGQPIVMNLILGMRSYFTTGSYSLAVFTYDYSYDSAYLASKNYASVINLVNPNVRADWRPPTVTSFVALSSTSVNLAVTGGATVNVTTRLVLQDDVSGFDGEIQVVLNKRIAARISAINRPFLAGEPMQFDVNLPIFDRPGSYPLSLVFKDKFKNVAIVSSNILAQQGHSVVVGVTGVMNPPLSNLEWLSLRNEGFGQYDVSFGYRRVVVLYNFGRDRGFFLGGTLNLTATGASNSNRGVVLQGTDGCHPRYGSNYAFYSCFFLDETTPLGLYLMTADVVSGLVYDSAALAAEGLSNNFTVTSFLTTGFGF